MGDAHADGGGGGCECTPPSSPERDLAAAQWSADQRRWEASSRKGGIHSDTPRGSDTQRSAAAHDHDARDLALMEQDPALMEGGEDNGRSDTQRSAAAHDHDARDLMELQSDEHLPLARLQVVGEERDRDGRRWAELRAHEAQPAY